MDAIFLPAPAYWVLAEDEMGGTVGAATALHWDTPLAQPAASHLQTALTTAFGQPPRSGTTQEGVRCATCAAIAFDVDETLADEHVKVIATPDRIVVQANSVGGFWRGTHLVIQLLGPELVCGMALSITTLPYPPVIIHDSPANPKRTIGLPLLKGGLGADGVVNIVKQLAAIGVNGLNLGNPLELEVGLLRLPVGMGVDDYAAMRAQAQSYGVTVNPLPEKVAESPQASPAAEPRFTQAGVELALWPDAVAAFANGWVGQRDPEAAINGANPNAMTWALKQHIAHYALFWAAQGISFVDGPNFVWTWHLIRLAPQPVDDGQTLVGLLLAPGTVAHGDHVEMQAGKEGIIGAHLAINAMVNGDSASVTLRPGHPKTGSTIGVYQVLVPSLNPGDDLRLAAIAQTNDGCSC